MHEFAERGSQRWLQIAVERHPNVLLAALRAPLGLGEGETIEWKSPLHETGFKEYRDVEALRQAGISKLKLRPLNEFWPARGPVWDAIGVAGERSIFVEAKAHIPEMASPGTKATPDSFKLIKQSLEQARQFYAPKATAAWTGTFYQYANRLAHHYLVRELNGFDSHLVFLYFTNDVEMKGPSSEEKWRGAIELLHAALGLSAVDADGIHEVFIDVRDLST